MFTSTANALARVVATSAESRGVSALKAVQAPGSTRCISNSSASSALPRTAHGISGRPQTAELILSPPFFAQAHAHSRFYATKSRKGKRRNDDEDEDDASNDPNDGYDDDVPVLNTRGKGAKGAKSKTGGSKSKHPNREHDAADSGDGIATTTRNQELPGEKFDIAQLAENMARAVKRCRETVSGMVGMMGRPDPAVLDSVRVPMPTGNEGGKGEPIEKASVPLLELATVGVRDGALWVTCYDPDSVKLVERGIYLAELGLTPQVIQNEDEAMIKIPIPRPTAETRAKLLKDLARICENARVSIRAARHQGQKDLASDQKRKIVGSEEARKEAKKLDEETKQHTAAVDKILEEMKNKVERAS
ncbi:unnamed protein product [Tilletia controversa]|uniref:Ribosome recycling factor domain-containing protein n=3 Tax=Tilletia TaxID=13289 RepID=A0A8X7SVQ6_9BASI|nr:hypothetical protein CF328_g4993 [Tilletia controversa]KAE8197245.1 hypothetical protein CF335_g4666 [Tilletia laevis]KAE8263803.1 hypothetical protein A4X03_0g1411 [Tilletia caries]KAE8198739.1 hypothetical protein CF336_g1533 [Tilletia laevis]KAE8245816.1 hypothetical protein A4X06_0g5402 [Tilletia controversa]